MILLACVAPGAAQMLNSGSDTAGVLLLRASDLGVRGADLNSCLWIQTPVPEQMEPHVLLWFSHLKQINPPCAGWKSAAEAASFSFMHPPRLIH